MNKSFKITIIVVVVLMAVFGYWQYSKNNSSDEKESLSTGTVSSANVEGSQIIINTLNRLEKIKIDKNFFDDRVFKSLTDFSHELVPEPIGRPNPFSPL